ncbi:MAG: InlB B-repeat-containing protein [Desulfuromonadaceae bacterium]
MTRTLTAIGLNIQYDPTVLEFLQAESAPDLVGKVADANVTDPGVPIVTSANVRVVISGGVVTLPYTNTPTLIGYLYFNVKEDATPVITSLIIKPDQAATPGRPAQTCTVADTGQKSQRINLIAGTNGSLTVLPSNPTGGPLNVYKTGDNGNSAVVIDPTGFSLSSLMYNVGNTVLLSAEPEIGFLFSHWTGGCTGTANPYTLIMSAGPVDCTANFVPDAKSVPTITWGTPTGIIYGSALSATQLNATASVAGTFVYIPAIGTILTAGFQALNVTFTPTDSATYATASSSVTIIVTPAALTVTAVNIQTGSGFVVNKSPLSPAIACPGTCTADYSYGTAVELSAVPSWHSAGLWTGCNSVTGMDCSVTIISDFGLKAEFFPLLTVLRSGPTSGEYNTIQSAYEDSVNDDILLIQEEASQTFQENLSLHLPVNIKLIGGMDSAYKPSAGFTVVKGSLKISGTGKVSVERIKIR